MLAWLGPGKASGLRLGWRGLLRGTLRETERRREKQSAVCCLGKPRMHGQPIDSGLAGWEDGECRCPSFSCFLAGNLGTEKRGVGVGGGGWADGELGRRGPWGLQQHPGLIAWF